MTATPANGIGGLVIGGAHGSLAIARSLGRRGIPVFYLTSDHQITAFSRYTTKSETWAGSDRPGAADELLEIVRRHRLEGWVLFPGGDGDVRMAAQNHGKLAAHLRLTTPPWESVQWALDKKLTYERAAALGIATPWSYYPRDLADVAKLDCRFPLILKPTTRTGANAFTLGKAWQVHDRASLLARYDQAAALVGEQNIVLQEMIPGGGEAQFSYSAAWQRGKPIASLTARRARQYPIYIGYTSTMVQTVDCPEVEDAGMRFLASLDYDGLGEVEFKYDSRDRTYKILDVNARAWTWNALGATAGVDFPVIAWQIATGENVAPARGKAHATWMHLSRDIVAGCQEIIAGRISVGDYLRSFRRPITFAEFAGDDPMPGLIDLPMQVMRLFTRRLPVVTRDARATLTASNSANRQQIPRKQPCG